MTSEMEEEMAQAEREDMDMFLEDTAERHNLSVANVKSILRVSFQPVDLSSNSNIYSRIENRKTDLLSSRLQRIATNEHMMTLWKSTMSEHGSNELPFEPKITRAKLRELKSKYPDVEESLLQRYVRVHSCSNTGSNIFDRLVIISRRLESISMELILMPLDRFQSI